MAGPMQERLHKYLAHCGIASRRECEVLIEEGRVEVNGEVVSRQGVKVFPVPKFFFIQSIQKGYHRIWTR